jgi:hypothetical protein
MATGSVLSLHRWPVKSLGGEPVETFRVDGRGVAGDRTHALWDEHRGAPRQLTVRQRPRMLAWHATYGGADVHPDDPPLPVLTAPDGRTFRWDDPALPEVVGTDLDRPVALRRDLAGQQDLHDSVLVTTQATLEAVSAALGQALDLRRFRTNVHLVLDAPAYAENEWEGRTLLVGEAELELLHPCVRCVIPTRDPDTGIKHPEVLRWLSRERSGWFGINARPRGAARVRVGDPVVLR